MYFTLLISLTDICRPNCSNLSLIYQTLCEIVISNLKYIYTLIYNIDILSNINNVASFCAVIGFFLVKMICVIYIPILIAIRHTIYEKIKSMYLYQLVKQFLKGVPIWRIIIIGFLISLLLSVGIELSYLNRDANAIARVNLYAILYVITPYAFWTPVWSSKTNVRTYLTRVKTEVKNQEKTKRKYLIIYKLWDKFLNSSLIKSFLFCIGSNNKNNLLLRITITLLWAIYISTYLIAIVKVLKYGTDFSDFGFYDLGLILSLNSILQSDNIIKMSGSNNNLPWGFNPFETGGPSSGPGGPSGGPSQSNALTLDTSQGGESSRKRGVDDAGITPLSARPENINRGIPSRDFPSSVTTKNEQTTVYLKELEFISSRINDIFNDVNYRSGGCLDMKQQKEIFISSTKTNSLPQYDCIQETKFYENYDNGINGSIIHSMTLDFVNHINNTFTLKNPEVIRYYLNTNFFDFYCDEYEKRGFMKPRKLANAAYQECDFKGMWAESRSIHSKLKIEGYVNYPIKQWLEMVISEIYFNQNGAKKFTIREILEKIWDKLPHEIEISRNIHSIVMDKKFGALNLPERNLVLELYKHNRNFKYPNDFLGSIHNLPFGVKALNNRNPSSAYYVTYYTLLKHQDNLRVNEDKLGLVEPDIVGAYDTYWKELSDLGITSEEDIAKYNTSVKTYSNGCKMKDAFFQERKLTQFALDNKNYVKTHRCTKMQREVLELLEKTKLKYLEAKKAEAAKAVDDFNDLLKKSLANWPSKSNRNPLDFGIINVLIKTGVNTAIKPITVDNLYMLENELAKGEYDINTHVRLRTTIDLLNQVKNKYIEETKFIVSAKQNTFVSYKGPKKK